MVPQFGGVYDDPALAAYVSSVGTLLARTSETPDLKFTFTVLNSPIVNAFALPGGYVYVTRGLLALAGDEAELAGVLAHEIGHVTARHAAERYGQTVTAQILQLGIGVLTGNRALTRATGIVSQIALRSFSREQEHEADLLGIRYLARAGYDPGAMAGFLEKLLADSRLEAELSGEPGRADEFNIMQTHPRTIDRVRAAMAAAGVSAVAQPMRARDIYLAKIDGLLYGDDPDEGFIRGRRFLHPKLRFAFEVPAGFRLVNTSRAVLAKGPDGAVIVFDRARKPFAGAMTAYLTRVWAQGVALSDVEAITINGLAAATGWTRLNTRRGVRDVRLVAIRSDDDAIYRMLFVTTPAQTTALELDLRRTTYSFRRLSPAEAAALKPLRLRIHTVRPGETVTGLAAHMAFPDHRLERFLVLNGLARDARLTPGDKVKLVLEQGEEP
ncbi:MAG: hypothetical protein D6826_10945 [Alphaproteobacteria bacterium]|nr:MAG: hypothetical protein D6826_10945 [Alphaproteobacteria bacterium]